MQLYSANLSPFAARVRIALYYKQLQFENLSVPADGLKSAEFLAINPMGKIPVLILDDGTAIVESETILEYLDDAYPERPLRPAKPSDRAQMRTIVRVTENYVTPPTARLFPHLDPVTRDAATVETEVLHMRAGLACLNHFVADAANALGDQLTLADCCLFPSLYLCEIIADQLSVPEVFRDAPRLVGYFRKARELPELDRIHEEITTALRAYQH